MGRETGESNRDRPLSGVPTRAMFATEKNAAIGVEFGGGRSRWSTKNGRILPFLMPGLR